MDEEPRVRASPRIVNMSLTCSRERISLRSGPGNLNSTVNPDLGIERLYLKAVSEMTRDFVGMFYSAIPLISAALFSMASLCNDSYWKNYDDKLF